MKAYFNYNANKTYDEAISEFHTLTAAIFNRGHVAIATFELVCICSFIFTVKSKTDLSKPDKTFLKK